MKKISMILLAAMLILTGCGDAEKVTEGLKPSGGLSTEDFVTETEVPMTATPTETDAPKTTTMPKEAEIPTETVAPTETVTPTETVAPKETATPTEAETKESESKLDKIRQQIKEQNAVCAVAYLGFYDGKFENMKSHFADVKLLDVFPFLNEIEKSDYVEQEGYEVYMVIPAAEDSILIVNEYLLNEYDGESVGPGNELGRFYDGKPVILRGNISEIIPNLYFEAENTDGGFIAFTPSLSLRDGSLSVLDGIYDISPYETLGIVKEEDEEGTGMEGIWKTVDTDGFKHTLNLGENGECSYGIFRGLSDNVYVLQ